MRRDEIRAMHLSFENDELRDLCNSGARLAKRFGRHADVVQRRLLALLNAPRLGDITVKPPDRRRIELAYGPKAFSVCAREAGRIYFKAGRSVDNLDDADFIEIFAIGKGSP